MSFSLKHIKCPKGNECTAFKCLFTHERDKLQDDPAAPEKSASAAEVQEPEEGPPKKRPRVDHPETPQARKGSSRHNGLTDTIVPDDQHRRTNPVSVSSNVRTANGPISPPPSRRAAQSSTSSAPASRGTTNAQSRVASGQGTATRASGTSTASRKAQTGETRKAETLYPRLLPRNPATHDVRFKLLKLLHKEFTRLNSELRASAEEANAELVMTDQELVTCALDREQSIAVQSPTLYANIMKNTVTRYKKMAMAQWTKERQDEVQSRPGSNSPNGSKKIPFDETNPDSKMAGLKSNLTVDQQVKILREWFTVPKSDWPKIGYSQMPTEAELDKARAGVEANKGMETCDRCSSRFQVFPGRREEDGRLVSKGTCHYHWGRKERRVNTDGGGGGYKYWSCCSTPLDDSAVQTCTEHNCHVYKFDNVTRLATVLNFKETPPNDKVPANRAVCFDCEMCYTVYGMELVRLTATSWPDGDILLDVLVQPLGEILDLNTRWSGVTAEMLSGAEAWSVWDDMAPLKGDQGLRLVSSPEVARDLLFQLISPDTPLIGHGLENDLNATRIVHPVLVDTTYTYKHKYFPARHKLKDLVRDHLGKQIQTAGSSGHDSAEDARAAGELVVCAIDRKWLSELTLAGWAFNPEGELVQQAT